ncbi:GILT-like protein 2 isoform X1 [Leguminivora glycinivorella]|uniref:GILT-like protein 2 isoform X1 n=1 Tax=Leguminivora glycinivorella TaxID=1035111 RepID=UPI00200C4A06|nr:GILT-like protein 2 isoform X1 [Leguminivora glycinivorella]
MLHSVLFCFTAFIAVECGFLTDIYRISPVADITSRDWDLQTLEIMNEDKVDLDLYYESLCPYCARFHIKRLDPVYKEMSSYIDLKVYPYGNARKHEEDGKTVIVCQHGEKECYGNKLHACAIDIVKDMTVAEPYISCMMNGTWGGGGSTDMDATKCGDLMKIDSKPIIECAKGKKGEELLEYYGKETEKVKFHGVPAVRINGEDFDLIDDLKKKICEALKNPPPECKTKNLLSLLNDFI